MGREDTKSVGKIRNRNNKGFSRFLQSVLFLVFLLVNRGRAEGTVYDLSEVLHGGWGTGKGEFGLIEREDFVTGPTNFIVDYSGNIYVSDSVNLRVQHFGEKGNFINALNFVPVDQEEPLIVHYTTCDRRGYLYVMVLDCEANLVKFSPDGRKLFLRKIPIWQGQNAIYPPLSLFRSDLNGVVYIVDSSSKRRLKVYTPDGQFDRSVEVGENFSVSPRGEVFLFSGDHGYVNCEVFDKGGKFVRKFRIPAAFGSELTRLRPGEIYFGPAGEIYFSHGEEGKLLMRMLSRDGQFLQDVPLGEYSGETYDYSVRKGVDGGYAGGKPPSLCHVDPKGFIYRSIARGSMFRILKYSPRAVRKAAIFQGLGAVFDVLQDGRGRIHILTDQGIYLFDPARGSWKLQGLPEEGMYRKFCFTEGRGYLIYEAKSGGLLILSEIGSVIRRVPAMTIRGIEVKGFRKFIERDGAVLADFGSGKIYGIGEKGELTFLLDKERVFLEGGASVKLIKGGYLGVGGEHEFDSYRVMDKNGETVGSYEFGSDTVMEGIKVVGEDSEGRIFIWCGLSRGVQLHLWTPRGGLEEVIYMDDTWGHLRWSDIIMSDRGEIFCVMSKKRGFEILRYSLPAER